MESYPIILTSGSRQTSNFLCPLRTRSSPIPRASNDNPAFVDAMMIGGCVVPVSVRVLLPSAQNTKQERISDLLQSLRKILSRTSDVTIRQSGIAVGAGRCSTPTVGN